jgi:hypothetical protein
VSGKDRTVRRLRAKHKKLLGELRYLYTDLEYHEEEHGYRKQEFQDSFKEWCGENGYDCFTSQARKTFEEKQVDPYKQEVTEKELKEIQEEVYNDPEELSEDPDDAEKELKALYKKIATKTHPDKLLRETEDSIKKRKQRLFMEAKQAYDNKNFFRLSQIAEELGVDMPPPSKQQLVWMREEKKRVEKIIESIAKTYEWICCEEGLEMPIEILYQQYADIIGCVKLEKEG